MGEVLLQMSHNTVKSLLKVIGNSPQEKKMDSLV